MKTGISVNDKNGTLLYGLAQKKIKKQGKKKIYKPSLMRKISDKSLLRDIVQNN